MLNLYYRPKLDPNIKTYGLGKTACRTSIATSVKSLLTRNSANPPTQEVLVDISGKQDNGLWIGFKNEDKDYFDKLKTALENEGLDGIQIKAPEDEDNVILPGSEMGLVIPHKHVTTFLRDICNYWQISEKNIIRDLYCNESGRREDGLKNITPAKRDNLRTIFKTYHLSETMSDKRKISKIIFDQSLHFKKAKNAHELLNLTIHAMKLEENKNDSHYELKKNEITERNEPFTRRLTIIKGGDTFLELSLLLINKPDANVAFVNALNRYRAGSARLYAGLGSFEEFSTAIMDFILKEVDFNDFTSDDNRNDPMRSLIDFLRRRKPNGHHVTISGKTGVKYLEGATIPEYISIDEMPSYLLMAHDYLFLAKQTFENDKTFDAYAKHNENPHITENVNMLLSDGTVGKVAMISMVGIDGRPAMMFQKEGLFEKSDRDQFYAPKLIGKDEFLMNKATEYYEQKWQQALEISKDFNVIFLNPVGCGAFDASKDGSELTKAAATGFSKALVQFYKDNPNSETKLVLPIFDLEKVYPVYIETMKTTLIAEKGEWENQSVVGLTAIIDDLINALENPLQRLKFDIKPDTDIAPIFN